jgi:succinoglycan biosynthesis protein ExoL
VTLLGFRRGAGLSPASTGAITLGHTRDGAMLRRAGSVAAALARLRRWGQTVADADVVLARQLETLAVAAAVRRQAAPQARLVFECLDIHRMMLGGGAPGRALRALEGRLLRGCDLLLTSSPGFVSRYFQPTHRALPPVRLLENRVLASEVAESPPAPRPAAGPPWRIGWFGVIRCQRSLHVLAALARRFPGRVEVLIRGRPALDAIPDFAQVVADTPGLTFGGPYDRRTDLAALYGAVHFTWAVDFFETGGNSEWLLPNRLYEGGLHGAVPIALGGVETGRWLEAHRAGIVLQDAPEAALPAWFATLDAELYSCEATRIAAVPRGSFIYDEADCRALVEALGSAPARTEHAAAGGEMQFAGG